MEIWKIRSGEIDDMKGLMRIRKSKERQHNGVGLLCQFQYTNRSQSISPDLLKVYVFYLYTFSSL